MDRAGNLRKNRNRIRTHYTSCRKQQRKKKGQHDRIFRDILALVISPIPLQDLSHPRERVEDLTADVEWPPSVGHDSVNCHLSKLLEITSVSLTIQNGGRAKLPGNIFIK